MKNMIVLFSVLLLTACSESLPDRIIIKSDFAPEPIGPYSQAVLVGNTLYCAGQIAIDPTNGKLVPGGIEAQTHRVLRNLQAVCREAGFDFNDVVQVQVFLRDLADYRAMNVVYAQYFKRKPPARAVVEAARIPGNALIEVMLTAVKSKHKKY